MVISSTKKAIYLLNLISKMYLQRYIPAELQIRVKSLTILSSHCFQTKENETSFLHKSKIHKILYKIFQNHKFLPQNFSLSGPGPVACNTNHLLSSRFSLFTILPTLFIQVPTEPSPLSLITSLLVRVIDEPELSQQLSFLTSLSSPPQYLFFNPIPNFSLKRKKWFYSS